MRKIIFVLLILLFIQSNVSGQVGFQTFLNYNSVSNRASEFGTDFIEMDSSFFIPFYCANAYQVDTLGYAKTYFAYSIISEMGKVVDTFRFSRKGHFLHAQNISFFRDSASYLLVGNITNFVQLVNDTIGTDLFLVKVNQQGDTLWTKTISFSDGDELPTKLIKTRDGGFAIVGQSCDKLETNCDMFLLKLDSNANEQWHQTYAWDNNSWELPNLITETNTGDFILTSMMFPIGSRNFYGVIFKTDSIGKLLWKKRPDKQNNQYSTIQDMVQNPSTGHYYFCGAIGETEIQPYHYQGWLIETDTSGALFSERKVGELNKELYFHKILLKQNNLFLVGETNNFPTFIGNLRPTLYKTNLNFSTQFGRYYDDSLSEGNTYIAYNLKTTSDGGFAMIGFGDDPKRAGNNQDVWFLKVDSNGCLYQPCLSVGVEQKKEEAQLDLLIYPQPAMDQFQINTDFEYESVELLQINGQIISNWQYSQSYYLPTISEGIYIIRLINKENEALIKKFSIGK